MAGKKPEVRIVGKMKGGDGRIRIAAAWKNKGRNGEPGKGFSVRLEAGAKIVLADGTTFTTGKDGNSYIDLYIEAAEEQAEAPRDEAPPPSDADAPPWSGMSKEQASREVNEDEAPPW